MPRLSPLRVGSALVAGGLLVSGSVARAERAMDLNLAAPAIDSYGFVSVDRAKTPGKFEFGVQALIGYSKAPLRETLANAMLQDNRYELVGHQITVDLGFSFGLTDWLSVAAILPMGVNFYDEDALGQPLVFTSPSAANPTGFPGTSGLYRNEPRQGIGISTTGPRDPRLAVKGRFYTNKYFEIGAIVEGTLPLGNKTAFLGEQTATLRPRLVTGVMFGPVNLGVSFGGIVRETATLRDPYLKDPASGDYVARFGTGHELTWGAGIGVRAHAKVSLSAEALGTIPMAGEATTATTTLLGALHFRPSEKWRITVAGGGGPLPNNPRNADGRVLLGLAYSVSPRSGGMP